MKRGKWKPYKLTKDQVTTIKENYLEVPIKTLECQMGIPEGVIRRRLKKWGLVIPPEIIEERKRNSYFKKGCVPFTKGLKQSDYMTPDQIKKTVATRFKKGQKPATTKQGRLHISIRKDKRNVPYKFIKIDDGFWEPLHVFNWHKEFGEVPEGHIIIFKDGDTLNCEPWNLGAITKAENLRRNRDEFLALPEDLKKTIGLVNKLKMNLNKTTNE